MNFGKIIQRKDKYVCTKCGKTLWEANKIDDTLNVGENIRCSSCNQMYRMIERDIKPGWVELELVPARVMSLHGDVNIQ